MRQERSQLRRRETFARCLPAAVALLTACAGHGVATPAGMRETHRDLRDVAITDVTVIDVESGQPTPGMTVVVHDGLIASVTPASAMNTHAFASNTRLIDGKGKFLIPGLWDMHVHFMNAGRSALPTLVVNGVTSVREMGGFIDSTRTWQREMAAGSLTGPHIVTPGLIVESPAYLERVRVRSERLNGLLAPRVLPYRIGVDDAASAQAAIDSLVKLHVDFVKMRSIGSQIGYHALLEAAARAGLTVVGHLPGEIRLGEASAAGQKSIEHLPQQPIIASGNEKSELFASMVRNQTWYTPTLVVSRAGILSADSGQHVLFDASSLTSPAMRVVSDWLLGWWRMQFEERRAELGDPREITSLEAAYRKGVDAIREMHEAGVPMLVGTDAGSLFVLPGPSVHEELRLLVQDAGFTPREALYAATGGPARFFGWQDRMGAIRAGYVADLVMLDGDPLTDIRNSRQINVVVLRGRTYDRAGLDSLTRIAEHLAGRFR